MSSTQILLYVFCTLYLAWMLFFYGVQWGASGERKYCTLVAVINSVMYVKINMN